MKLFNRCNLKWGECMPEVWFAFGKHELRGSYIIFHIPLFYLMWGYNAEKQVHRFGWYVPSIRLIWNPNNFIITWVYMFHSDFMEEKRVITDH